MTTVHYDQWYYLIYLLPGAAALLTLLASALAGGRHHRAHAVAHAAHAAHGGHGIHLPHVSHQTAHAGAAHVAHSTAAAHHATAAHATPLQAAHNHNGARTGHSKAVAVKMAVGESVLFWFGIGRVPTPLVLCSLLLGWSLFGFWTTRGLEDRLHYPALFIAPALIAAAFGALAGARLSAVTIGRIMPSDESQDVSTPELIGLTGEVAFAIDDARGRVYVYDQYRTLHDCSARAPAGRTIARGKDVLVVDYDPAKDQLVVEETV